MRVRRRGLRASDGGDERMMSWVYVAITIVFAVYSQLVVKWRVSRLGALPGSLHGKLEFFGHLLFSPWILSAAVAVGIGALSWMAAMSHLQLSRAYPFVGLTFVLVLLFSGIFFNEPFTLGKVLGTLIVVAGLIVGVVL